MRPIDADAFKKYIDAQEGRPFIGCTVGEAMKILIDEQPTVQPEVLACGNGKLVAKSEPADIDAREAVYNLAEKIGIHRLYALTVELRGEPTQPEPSIPLSWIEKYIEWLKSFDNEFANLESAHISVMVKKWRDEQDE